jgi:hypothetical protein
MLAAIHRNHRTRDPASGVTDKKRRQVADTGDLDEGCSDARAAAASKSSSNPSMRLAARVRMGNATSGARRQDLVECLDLPPHGVPIELFNNVVTRPDRQVGDQFPVSLLATFWNSAPLGMDYRQSRARCRSAVCDLALGRVGALNVQMCQDDRALGTVRQPKLYGFEPHGELAGRGRRRRGGC